MDNGYGSDALLAHTVDYQANAVFTMQDVPNLDPNHLQQLQYWIPYVPIDKDPVPPAVLFNLRYAYKIITFSKFGQDALQRAGFTSTLILEGTDTELMKPMDQAQCRKDYGLPPEAFIFGMIAANKENPPRKGFQEALTAFKMFSDKHPEAILFIHSQQRGPGSFPVENYAEYLKISNKICYVNPYQAVVSSDSKKICKELNCFDVLLHPSMTEGFGLTVIEALSCGVPVIVNNTTSMPEMVQDGITGFVCDTNPDGFYTSDASMVYKADVKSLYDKMEQAFTLVKEKKQETAKACRDSILDKYDLDKIYQNNWKPFLEELQEEILPLQTPIEPLQLNQQNISPVAQ